MLQPTSFTNVTAIPILPERLYWSNYITFQRHIMDNTASRSTAVGTSGGFDFEPSADLPPHATMADLKRFEREERAFNTYRKNIELQFARPCTKVSVHIFRTE